MILIELIENDIALSYTCFTRILRFSKLLIYIYIFNRDTIRTFLLFSEN